MSSVKADGHASFPGHEEMQIFMNVPISSPGNAINRRYPGFISQKSFFAN